jgi:glycosyltransferase 2 family protein
LKKTIVAVFRYLLFLAVGFVLLWLALRGLDFSKIGYEFRNARYFWILLSLIPGFIAIVSRAMRWNIMINALGYKSTLGSTLHAVIMGYFTNTIFPRLGEVTRCTVLSRRQNIPLSRLFGTVISERAFDLISLGIISFFVIIAQFGFLRGFLERMIWGPLSARLPSMSWLIVMLGISILLASVLFYILFYVSRPYLRKLSFYGKIKDLLLGFVDGIKTIKNIKQKKAFIAHTVLIWFMYFLMSYIPFRALQATEHLTLIDGTTLLIMGSLGFVIPVPAGIGAYHWIVSKTLTDLYGIASEAAASFALMVHASQIFLVVFLGIISMIYLLFIKKQSINVNIGDNQQQDI